MWDKEKDTGKSGHRQKHDPQENETQRQMNGKMERERERDWNNRAGQIGRENGQQTEQTDQSCNMFEHRHTECIIQWEWALTVFGECPELSRVDHPAGDPQLDSFSFQPLQPGQQSPALREAHHKTSAVTWNSYTVYSDMILEYCLDFL